MLQSPSSPLRSVVVIDSRMQSSLISPPTKGSENGPNPQPPQMQYSSHLVSSKILLRDMLSPSAPGRGAMGSSYPFHPTG